ncbi:MAG: monovalent cation/H(+) antiporter subunit G [Bacillota bacterium]|nr:monovalent cation/H(+) antiporter subunit G [Bacillota bacterium]
MPAAVRDPVVALLLGSGIFFFSVSTLGLLRLPDVYTRLHATAKGDTLGVALVILGGIVYLGWQAGALKLALILGFLWLTSPTAAHLVARTARRCGVPPASGHFQTIDLRQLEGSGDRP